MPPRHAYWTILIDNAPTAFRAREKEDLLPTLNQLRRTNKDVLLKWFGRGKLWDTPEAAQTAGRTPTGPDEKRGRDWRPGGTHKDPRDRFKKGGKRRHDALKIRTTAGQERDKPRGAPPAGAQPWRDKPRGAPPAGAQSWRDKPRGAPPAGAQSWRDNTQPWRNRPDPRTAGGAGQTRHQASRPRDAAPDRPDPKQGVEPRPARHYSSDRRKPKNR
jgi:hypothetical protein